MGIYLTSQGVKGVLAEEPWHAILSLETCEVSFVERWTLEDWNKKVL